MGNENNQPEQTADSQTVPANAKLSVLGQALGFGKSGFEQPSAATNTQPESEQSDKNSDPLSEQPQSDSGRDDLLNIGADRETQEDGTQGSDQENDDPDSQQPGENDPLALLFDSDTSYDLGDGEIVTGDELKNRFMRQSDYTKKTQELATERTTLETERQGYADNLMFFDAANQQALSEYQNVNWAALQMHNPAQYQELLGGYQQLQMRQQQIDTAKNQFLEGMKARNAAGLETQRAKAIDDIRGEVPDIDTMLPELETVAKSVGFTDDELPQMMADPRALKLLVSSYRVGAATQKAKQAMKPNATPQPRPRAEPTDKAKAQTQKARLTKAANSGDQGAARALLAGKLSSQKFNRFNG